MALAFASAIGCYAQETEARQVEQKNDSVLISRYQNRRTMRGLKAFFEAGYQWGLGDGLDGQGLFADIYKPSKGSAGASVGYQFNNFVFLGGGVDFQVYRSGGTTYLAVPFFGELRVNFLNNKRVTPFFGLRAGYGVGDIGGVYDGLQIGVRCALPRNHAVSLVCQYDVQIPLGDAKKRDFGNDCLGFKLGYEF